MTGARDNNLGPNLHFEWVKTRSGPGILTLVAVKAARVNRKPITSAQQIEFELRQPHLIVNTNRLGVDIHRVTDIEKENSSEVTWVKASISVRRANFCLGTTFPIACTAELEHSMYAEDGRRREIAVATIVEGLVDGWQLL